MRMVFMLIAILIVGMLVYKQLGGSGAARQADYQQTMPGPAGPQVPMTPAGVQQFGEQMNSYMEEEAAKRAQTIRDAEPR